MWFVLVDTSKNKGWEYLRMKLHINVTSLFWSTSWLNINMNFLSYTYIYIFIRSMDFSGGSAVKNLPAVQETQVQSLVRKIPWKRKWKLTPVLMPGKSHGQRSLGRPQSMGLPKSLTWLRDYITATIVIIKQLIILFKFISIPPSIFSN